MSNKASSASPSRFRMPVVFGPTPGPRWGEKGGRFDMTNARRSTIGVDFRTDAARLSRLLPPRCTLQADPIVSVEHVTLHDLPWLAGRSYRLLSIKFPVHFDGRTGRVSGPFLAVLWENLAEPILSGREELGFAKLFGVLPEPDRKERSVHCKAIWDGHVFAEIEVHGLTEVAPPAAPSSDGVLHYRYVPAVSSGGQSIEEMVLSPAGHARVRVLSHRTGQGKVHFAATSWEQMPTMAHIVNRLAELPVEEAVRGWASETVGSSDLSEQRALEPVSLTS